MASKNNRSIHVNRNAKSAVKTVHSHNSKKKILLCVVCVTVVAGLIGLGVMFGHSDKSDDEVMQEYPKYPEYPTYDASALVELGDYKHMDLPDIGEVKEPTAEEIDAYVVDKMPYIMDDAADVQAVLGDQVNIDFVGKINGTVIKHGVGKDYDLILGSHKMIDSFENALVGLKTGDKKVFRISFPDDYKNQQVRGKTAEFTVQVNSIAHKGDVSDENVAVLTNSRLTTVAEMRTESRDQLLQNNRMNMQENVKTDLYKNIREVCKVKSVPQELVDWYVESMVSTYKYKAMSYGLTLPEYLANDLLLERKAGKPLTSEEELREYFVSVSGVSLENEVIMHAIAQAEGITVTDDEYNESVDMFAKRYGFRSAKVFESAYQKSGIVNQMLMDKVVDFLVQTASGGSVTE